MALTSNTYSFSPSAAEFLTECFARIQIYSPQLTILHLVEARRSANFILSDISSDRGVNLWAVDLIQIPLTPGILTFTLPANTVDLLDVYIRTFTPPTTGTVNLGAALTPIVSFAGAPVIGTPFGDPVVSNMFAGAFNTTAGSTIATLKWPAHGLLAGAPIFWGCPVSVGGMSLSGFTIVSNIVDTNNVQFTLPNPALESMFSGGGTPLFFTTSGSGTVGCILPGHNLLAGSTFTVPIATTVGGLTLSGTYTVASVQSSYQFAFAPGGTASSTAVAFENSGQPNVVSQSSGIQYTDSPLFPISRNDYASLSVKATPGRPTSYWVDRIVPPTVTIYPVAPTTGNQYYGMAAYRMRELQDFNPTGGLIPDLAKRAWQAFLAELTASLAEKFKPEMWAEKSAAAKIAWDRMSSADVERVTTKITPQMDSYFR